MIKRQLNHDLDLLPSARHKFEAGIIKKKVKGKSVLEIGCWTGQILSVFENEAKCTGLDIDKDAISFAKKYRKGFYVLGSALKLPFKKETFDVVIMSHLLEHLPLGSENIAISEAARVLKKRGLLALSVPSSHILSVIMDPAYFLLGHRHYSQKQLMSLLKENNFKIEKIISYGNLMTLLTDNLHLLSKHFFNLSAVKNFIARLSENTFKSKGFVAIYILAQKI